MRFLQRLFRKKHEHKHERDKGCRYTTWDEAAVTKYRCRGCREPLDQVRGWPDESLWWEQHKKRYPGEDFLMRPLPKATP